MKEFVNYKNVGLIVKRGFDEIQSAPGFVSKLIIDRRAWSRPGMQGAEQLFPLYCYSDDGVKISNLKEEIIAKITKIIGKTSPEEIFDYIYGILYSPSYREKYKEFLKIDFPRVPYPISKEVFDKLAELGKELRETHLLESPRVNQFITTFQIEGENIIEKKYPKYQNGNVYVNKAQYFGNVPEVAWNFYVGGYQPAQKWLKDRQERALSSEDIGHYQKIIVSLVETNRIMKEIDIINM
jgi:predicted helicase